MIGINIGSQSTKFSVSEELSNKEIYSVKDFKLNINLNDILDRFIPSIIQFKEKDLLFGQSTQLGYKKYCLSTFNNLSRLIGFVYELEINNKEMEYFITLDNYDQQLGNFFFTLNEKEHKFVGDYCVCAFLSKLNKKIKMKLNTQENPKYIFSVPDYYTYYQKESLKQILEALNLRNNLPFINESTAITMYYGYLNYIDLTDQKKYIIFIDIGHSKTSFILSRFTKNEFVVRYVENILFLGGRDFNNIIFNKCLEKFKEKNGYELKVKGRNKIRLMEEIEKARKNLSINTETEINVDALDNDIDFNYYITREEFETLIKDKLDLFKKRFESFFNEVKKILKDKNSIYKIEMGGQLMRTPILQKIINEITGISISKTISCDECHSLGVLLYGTFILEKRKFQQLEFVNSYNMYFINYKINEQNERILMIKGENIPFENKILIDEFTYDMILNILYDKKQFKDPLISKSYLYSYKINNQKIKKEINAKNFKEKKKIRILINYNTNEANEIIFKFEINGKRYSPNIIEITGMIHEIINQYNKKYYTEIENNFK